MDNVQENTIIITPLFEKGKKTINTAVVVAEKLNKSTVLFSTDKDGIPSIFMKFEGQEKYKCMASLGVNYDRYVKEYETKGGNTWHHTFPKRYSNHGLEWYMFEHLTDSAEGLVSQFIHFCIEKFDAELAEDNKKLEVSVSFSILS